MRRGIAIGVPGVALATAGGLWAQLKHTANTPLPHYRDLDPSGDYGPAGGTPVRITVLGDSSLTGPGLESAEHIWMAQLADRLPWSVQLRSHARGGSRVRDVLVDQAPGAITDPPDLFVISVGSNDAMHATPTRAFERNLDALLEMLGAVAPVVTLGVGDLSVIPRLPRTFRPVVAHRSAVIDRAHKIVSADHERAVRIPVGKLSDHHFRRGGTELFAGDLFHPSRSGHALWAELFGPIVHRATELAVDSRRPRGAVIDLRSVPSPVG